MPRQKQDTIRLAELASIEHEPVTWCNDLISSPISCSLLERRVMYFITGVVKHKYVENGLNVPENWKELYFYMTDRDLGIIGGQKNIRYTYDVLTKLGMKFFPITYHRPNGSVIVGRIHWGGHVLLRRGEGHVRHPNLTGDYASADQPDAELHDV